MWGHHFSAIPRTRSGSLQILMVDDEKEEEDESFVFFPHFLVWLYVWNLKERWDENDDVCRGDGTKAGSATVSS